MQRHCSLLALAGGDLLVLLLFRSAPTDLGRQLGHPREWLARVGTDAALTTVTGTALWVAAAWLGLGLVSAGARRAPGRIGALANCLCAAVLPRIVLRLVAGSTGLGILLAPLPAVATTASTAGVAAAATASEPVPVPAPVWPSTTPPAGHARPVDAPRWPSATTPVAHPSRRRGASVTVQPGDCLWLIAARRLGQRASDAAVTAAWPRWYAANRPIIGADPNVILPGEVLQAPPSHPSEARS
jgi:nucleoid-associated protein YgaU